MALEIYKDKYPIEILYTATNSEHPDNKRFMSDCEKWFGHKIKTLQAEKYYDVWEVFEKTRYLVGVAGARCTTELKKKLRNDYQKVWSDIQVFGFDSSEAKRVDRFQQNNPEVKLVVPLIDENISKEECLRILSEQEIEAPAMYKLGYHNNNCIGCVKGQSGYWNKIRKDFPDVFNRMAKVERKLNVAINKSYAGDGKRKRVFLDELHPDAGRDLKPIPMDCGVLCDAEQPTKESD